MSKEIYISSTPHETRLAIVENDALTEIYYERENEYTLAGSIYNGKVTRVLPGMQSSFVDIGLDRDAFLYITDFMEEAGDAADFESTVNGGEQRRLPRESVRQDGGRGDHRRHTNERSGRNTREDRSEQAGPSSTVSEQPAEPVSAREPTDSELFTEAMSSLDPARSVSNSERGVSRQGGRSRGDRTRSDRNSDGTPRRDRQPERVSANRVDSSRTDIVPVANSASMAAEQPSIENSAEVGEGSPGADGSRRWRGRRGRRGNQSDAPHGNEASTVEPVAEAQAVVPEPTGPEYNAYPTENIREASGNRAARSGSESRSSRSEHDGGLERGRPRTERDERGSRSDRGPQAPRVPRGFAPSASLYQVDGAAETVPDGEGAKTEAEIVPIVLPGESISKYRGGKGETTAAAVSIPSPTPATDFIAAGWDGGTVLPGETIRPRSAKSEAATGSEVRRESGRGNERAERSSRASDPGIQKDRNVRSDRGLRPASQPHRAEAEVEPAPMAEPLGETITSQAFPAAKATGSASLSDAAVASSDHQDIPINSTFVPPPPIPAHPSASSSPVASEREYEPVEATASYRVDPVAPSEFRQSAPVVEEADAAGSMSSSDVESASVGLDHQLTSISAEGEMHSEPTELTTQELTAPSPSAQGAQESTEPLSSEVAASDQSLPYFAPGVGLLEEETLEDEDDVTPGAVATLHAQSDHEEETLEGAADLGSMIREMSIDRTTRGEPIAADGEDDFLEEDQDFEEAEFEDAEESGRLEPRSNGSSESGAEVVGDEDESAAELEQAAYGSALETEPAGASGGEQTGASLEPREPRRDGRSSDRSRRDGRRGDRERRPGSGERSSGDATGDRDRGRDRDRDRGRGRQSMQSTNLPAISDLLKPGQEVLVQIAKEPIAKKGARITSHIALPGRFLVFMPTVHHTGVSRKIESDAERRRLKEILLSEKGEAAGGFIVRTAASGASEDELRSDLRFLLNLWADIKNRSEGSKSPALIYHDLNLVERVLRDQVTDTFSAIWVDTETEYERVLRFLQRFQPALIRRVKLYTKETPLFEQFGITEEINKALRSKVWLKSGGSIVINQTEALVAIDINTGKFVGKTARLEDTIVKTNLDAIPEIVRQIRLRDLGGIIIIDFIDMDDRKNRNRVMAALEDELKNDRAPSKMLPFNDFGLIAITRKRVKQSLERTLSSPCAVCQGTGMTKSPVTVCNDIYIEMRKMHKHLDRGDVMLRVHPEVVKQLKLTGSHWLQEMEEMVGKTILVKSDPSLHPEQFDLH